MSISYLKNLNDSVRNLLEDKPVIETISHLKEKNTRTDEPFVWAVIEPTSLPNNLPENIKSAWIFVLKKGIPSGCHYHPNSIQHMVLVEGQGESRVGGETKRLIKFDASGHSLDDIWYVIGEGVEHEFFPEERDMVVISFHTCEVNDLEEITCGTEESRLYEKGQEFTR